MQNWPVCLEVRIIRVEAIIKDYECVCDSKNNVLRENLFRRKIFVTPKYAY
jgi:hypothetical protein